MDGGAGDNVLIGGGGKDVLKNGHDPLAAAALAASSTYSTAAGTSTNFTFQGGMGTTYQLSDRVVPMGGLRWLHISNARIKGKERNAGFDSPMFYVGIMMPLQTRNYLDLIFRH